MKQTHVSCNGVWNGLQHATDFRQFKRIFLNILICIIVFQLPKVSVFIWFGGNCAQPAHDLWLRSVSQTEHLKSRATQGHTACETNLYFPMRYTTGGKIRCFRRRRNTQRSLQNTGKEEIMMLCCKSLTMTEEQGPCFLSPRQNRRFSKHQNQKTALYDHSSTSTWERGWSSSK